MIYRDAERLIRIVRSDDVKEFREIASPDLFASVFGRFPILSVLYLLSARKIIRAFRSDLMKDRPRAHYEAISEVDAFFMRKAGKALRYYHDKEVSPLEMLAVLGEESELKRAFREYPFADRYLQAINAVYVTRLGEGVVRKGDDIFPPKEALKPTVRRMLFALSFVLLGLFVLTLSISIFVPLWYGFGTEKMPYLIRNEQDFTAHGSKDIKLSLKNDLTLSATAEKIAAEIIGNDRIIHLTAPFADTFTGILRNVTFVLEEGYPADAVIKTNQGKLENVSVVTRDLVYDKASFVQKLPDTVNQTTQEVIVNDTFSLFTTVNQGVITSCTAVVTMDLVGEEGGNSYFAPFVSENYGTVQSCRADGKVTSLAVDMAGIAVMNYEGGALLDCGSSMEITQRTSIKGWNPNVAGIVCENMGTVDSCVNGGKISSIVSRPSLEEEDNPAVAYIAGIAVNNSGTLSNCTNDGEIVASGTNGYAYAAGIVIRHESNGRQDQAFDKNTSKGRVSAFSSTHEAHAAGIALENYASIDHCENKSEVVAEVKNTSEGIQAACSAGIVYVNYSSISQCVNNGKITATGEGAYALAGGIVTLNNYTLRGSRGFVQLSSGFAEVIATSTTNDAYAGGIAAKNELYAQISGCRQTAKVLANAPAVSNEEEIVFSATGGICGIDLGKLEYSFYTGELSDFGEKRYVGGICGYTILYCRKSYNMMTDEEYKTYSVYLTNNAFATGEKEAYAIGSLLMDEDYEDLEKNNIYGTAEVDLTQYASDFDRGTIKVGTAEELTSLDLYKEVAGYYE